MAETIIDIRVPGNMSVTNAYLHLSRMDKEHGKGKGLEGYKPYVAVGREEHEGTVQVSCEIKDTVPLKDALEGFLAERDRRIADIAARL